MPTGVFSCPSCRGLLQAGNAQPGSMVRCPRCQTAFSLPGAEGSPPPPPPLPEPRERQDRPERDAPPVRSRAEENPPVRERSSGRRDYYDDDDDLERDYEERDYGDRIRRRGPGERGLAGLSNRYSIDLGEWFNYAGAHWNAVLGPMIGFMLLYFLIVLVVSVVPIVGPLARLLIDPPMQAGIAIVCLAQLKGREWTFGDFFGGFQHFGPLLGNYLLTALIGVCCLIPVIVGVVVLAVVSEQRNRDLMQVVGLMLLAVAAINIPAAIYIMIRATMFNVQFIVERGCGPVEAIQASWTISSGHFWGLFGAAIVIGVIAFVGVLLCGIGLLFTVPYALLIQNAGYLLIAGSQPPVMFESRGRRREQRDDWDDR